MVTTALPILPAEVAGNALPQRIRLRRAAQRRRMLDLVGLSYVTDACILLIYACAGTIPVMVGPAYAAAGLAAVAFFIALSEAGINDRFKDHYFVLEQTTVSMLLMTGFAYAVPEVGFLFFCSLFVVYSFAALRSSLPQNAVAWSILAMCLAALVLLADRPIALPHGSLLERFATLLALITAIGRCMIIGNMSSNLRESLYKRGIQLREAYKRIEELAELDELTGAFNRRCIMRALVDEIEHAEQTGAPLSVVLLDLDWFKRINDTYGHPTGDEVLRTLAITIFANIRGIDKFGRYGGEEFLLILPNTPNDQAVDTLDRLRSIVADLDWSAFASDLCVTLSAGVATLKQSETPESILARADSALYVAKNGGRNRIASA